MTQFAQNLHEDALGIKTSARYDSGATAWLADVANYIQNGAGIWVPLGAANPMPSRATNYYLAIGTNSVEAEKTATATAVAATAGGSALPGRKVVYIINPATNTQSIRCGSTTNTIDELWPGEEKPYPVDGATIYVKSPVADQPYRIREA